MATIHETEGKPGESREGYTHPAEGSLNDVELHLTPEQLFPPHLAAQVERFIQDQEAYNKRKPEHAQRDPRNFDFLRHFFERSISERNARSYEVATHRYIEARNLANAQFSLPTYFVDCIDGRVLTVLKYGASAGIASSIRVPGGILREFVRSTDGNLILREDSTFADSLDGLLDRSPSDAIAEVFDSHLGCAARAGEQENAGEHPDDAGLYADVVHKREMAMATKKYVKGKYGDTKRVVTIQTSFNPHTGYMYMGLETDAALEHAKNAARLQAGVGGRNPERIRPEFTGTVLNELATTDRIIDTQALVNDPQINAIFAAHSINFNLDWKNNYVESAVGFWNGIAGMKYQLLPIIAEKLQRIYPELTWPDRNGREELEERAMLILTNAFSGYLLNGKRHPRKTSELEEIKDLDEAEHHYGYGIHEEQFIKVYEGGHPPYNISSFVVFSRDTRNLANNVQLAEKLVRKNRRETKEVEGKRVARVVDASGNFPEPEDFEAAVVPVVIQAIVRSNGIKEEDWRTHEQIDWYDPNNPMPKNWDTMNSAQFFNFLYTKGIIPETIARVIKLRDDWTDKEFFDALKTLGITIPPIAYGINELRQTVAVLYDPELPISSTIIDQQKVVLPVISEHNRRNRLVLPFTQQGLADAA